MSVRRGSAGAVAPRLRRVPVPALFMVSAVSQYAGAAIAVLLFAAVEAVTVAWLRVLTAALVLGVAGRSRGGRGTVRGTVRERLGLSVALGLALATMNASFYLAIDRLPLGTAVAIEFLGPVAVAAVLSRTRTEVVALVVAAGGVALLADVRLEGSPAGVAFALLAAAGWAAYVVASSRAAGSGRGADRLRVGMVVAALALTPLGLSGAGPAVGDPRLVLVAAAVGVLSSVIPYSLDQVALSRTTTGRFAVLLALLPATAAIVGAVVLRQLPTGQELVGIAAVTVAVRLGLARW